MRLANVRGRLAIVNENCALDVATASGGRFAADVGQLFAEWDELQEWACDMDPSAGSAYELNDLGPPVIAPRQVFAVALNYAPHAAEAGFDPPKSPLVFTKFPSCLAGPAATIELPVGNVDWEVELVAVIGRGAHRVAAADVWPYVAGFTVGQDLSERLLQSAGKPAQFSLGKSYPGFGPLGPALVTIDEFADPDSLDIGCSIGTEQVQHANTREMLFTVCELVEFISHVCPLGAGDLIFTGTPDGVGNRRTPKRFLTPADELISTIEGIGSMRHRFSAPGAPHVTA